MGAGKTSVGKALAARLRWRFEDLDARIESREKRRIHEIFRNLGESGFRKAEHSALRELLEELQSEANKVVAVGGGAFAQAHNFKLIEAAGISTVFLDAPVEVLWRRCCAQAQQDDLERPLLSSLSSFRELYKARQPHYLRASFRQKAAGKTVEEIAIQVAEVIGRSSDLHQKRRKRGDTH
jgi:shikimate kinase